MKGLIQTKYQFKCDHCEEIALITVSESASTPCHCPFCGKEQEDEE